jgi:hypothetical protein
MGAVRRQPATTHVQMGGNTQVAVGNEAIDAAAALPIRAQSGLFWLPVRVVVDQVAAVKPGAGCG